MSDHSDSLMLAMLRRTFAGREEVETYRKEDLKTRTSIQKTLQQLQKAVSKLPTKTTMDQDFLQLRQDFDKTLDQKLSQLRDDMNKDFAKSVMPLVYNHDERLDRIDKNLDLPPIPVRLPQ